MTALLELIPAIRTGIKFSNGCYKSERHFLDFTIDGQSLWEKLKKPDMVSVLCFEYAAKALDESIRAANRLLLRPTVIVTLTQTRRPFGVCRAVG